MSEVILVEGEGDKDFVNKFLQRAGFTSVMAYPPRPLGARGNGIGNLISVIGLLFNDILAGSVSKAAIVVDADHAGINGGFAARRAEVVQKLSELGYEISATPSADAPAGEIFSHPDGHAEIGLFIFPNHRDDGMLEDLLKTMVVKPQYQTCLSHAVDVVDQLPEKFFNPQIHTSKAEIGTFLAWQKKPPAYAGVCVEEDIFSVQSEGARDFLNWLQRVFQIKG